jgi:hypothetical protein
MTEHLLITHHGRLFVDGLFSKPLIFVSSVLFTDEATFDRDGITNLHNQQQFRIHLWVGIFGDCLVRPDVLPRPNMLC